MLPAAAWAWSLLSLPALTQGSIPPLHSGRGRVSPCTGELGFFSTLWKYRVSASYSWNTVAPSCPLSLWPKTSHWDADVTSTIPLSAVDAGSHNVPGVQKQLSSLKAIRYNCKFSHSFYSEGTKLPILSNNHRSNDTGAMSCLCEPNQNFLGAMHLSSASQGLFFPLYVSQKIHFLLVESSDEFYWCTSQSELMSLLYYLYGLSGCL